MRTRGGKTFKRAAKSDASATEGLSEREVITRIEEHLKRTGYKTPKFLQRIHEQSKKNGLDKMTMREINAVIKEARKELQQKQK
jgi:hypothetical protein